MVPSLLCLPPMVTAPSCPSLLGSWVLLWRSRPPWRSLPQTTVLRKKARNWPGLHLQGTWLPHLSVVLEKKFPLSPLQRRRRAPRLQRASLSPAGSHSTLWKAGGSLLPLKLPLFRWHPQWAPALLPLPYNMLSLSLLITLPQPCHTHPSLPPPQKAIAKQILQVLQHQRVQPHQKDPPQGKIKIIIWLLLVCFILVQIALMIKISKKKKK